MNFKRVFVDRRAFVLKLVLAEALARRGEGPLAPRVLPRRHVPVASEGRSFEPAVGVAEHVTKKEPRE